jgi:LuxR family maltose regulon positive regulatory protein
MLALVRSRLQVARGDVTGAVATVEQTAGGVIDQSGWLAGRLRLEAARLRIATDETAVAVLEIEGLAEHYPAEVALVVAQERLREGDDEAAREALSQVLVRSTSLGVQVNGWVVEAARQLQHGSSGKAWTALDRSLRLAAKECLRRPFREAPAPVAKLLAGDAPLGVDIGWLNVTPKQSRTRAPTQGLRRIQASTPGDLLVVERLTDKELEVLGHLAELLTTEEIANMMFVSVNTIRTHVRSILRKLGVPRRNAAVRRARELDLLPL